jgi:hypothetical protein
LTASTGKNERGLALDGEKWCGKCSLLKPLSEFYVRRASKDGRSYRCKPCSVKNSAEWMNAKPKEERQRIYLERDLRRKFGISTEVYNAVFLAQEGVCAICKQPNPNKNRLAVDHNHETGEVRGLLCGPCNMLLYRIENDPDWANKAFSYLSKSTIENLLGEGEKPSHL